ncbi:Arylsulfatase [Gimesia alba]|uniref:Arylsulfatase n=1 Tax=Gimesia alba TaxID=2527973 RepID=A0A517RMH7_9PLAN|nr:sulfatase [Gimesia alba]QDT45076.1 Arylsulfatase [Gimesia alba]
MIGLLQRVVCSTVILLVLGGSYNTPANAAERPWNVVFFLVDDLGWTDLGCYGSDYYQTPNINRLASEGMKFTQNYAACNACSPTRGALMSGMYPARTHLTDWIPGWAKQYRDFPLKPPEWKQHLDQKYTSLPEALHDAGYKTLHIGKWHLGGAGNLPQDHGFDVNIAGTKRGLPRSYHFPYGGDALKWDSRLTVEQREGRYLTDRLTDEAVTLIKQQQNNPFFLYFSFYSVHSPIQGRPDLVQKYKQLPQGEHHKNPEYAAMVQSVDTAVGRVRKQLKQSGIADRTLIVFTSDNGGVCRKTSSNVPLRGEKGQHWEGGTRVPAIVLWPGVTQSGSVCSEPIITMDFYPTLLNITGAEGNAAHNKNVDGVSLVRLLKDPAASLDRKALYWHYPHYNVFIGVPYSAIRAGDYKLIHFYEDNHSELYDLAHDLSETHDLSAEKPEITARLQKQLQDHLKQVGAQMPVPNPGYKPAN